VSWPAAATGPGQDPDCSDDEPSSHEPLAPEA